MKAGHLTSVDPALDNKAALTHPGQAHFVELGSGHRCAQCAFFHPLSRSDQRGRCLKAANFAMKNLFSMPVFPAAATACKYWQELEE